MKFLLRVYNVELGEGALCRFCHVYLGEGAEINIINAQQRHLRQEQRNKGAGISKSVKIFLKKNFDRFGLDG